MALLSFVRGQSIGKSLNVGLSVLWSEIEKDIDSELIKLNFGSDVSGYYDEEDGDYYISIHKLELFDRNKNMIFSFIINSESQSIWAQAYTDNHGKGKQGLDQRNDIHQPIKKVTGIDIANQIIDLYNLLKT